MTHLPVNKKVLNENDVLAAALRADFVKHGVFVLNLISGPGSGKTALLERTLASYHVGRRVAVLTGDIPTSSDAQRLAKYGFPVRQITTAGVCHLDARMIRLALEGWNLSDINTLFIESLDNLVCPTSFDLGEHAKVVVLSVTEGEETPLKYPDIFYNAELMILSKIDLLPYVPFDLDQAKANARLVHPGIEIIGVSSTSGAGFIEWLAWLEHRRDVSKLASSLPA